MKTFVGFTLLCVTSVGIVGSTAWADFGYDDSPPFELNLLSFPLGGAYDHADSRSFPLDLYPVNRAWADSGAFDVDTGSYHVYSTLEVRVACRYDAQTGLLYIEVFAYDRAAGQVVATGPVTYELPLLGFTGELSYSGHLWSAVVDLTDAAPRAGEHLVYVDVQGVQTQKVFNVILPVGTISGTLRDVTGAAIAGCEVYLYKGLDYFYPTAEPCDQARSDAEGGFAFTGLLPEIYAVSAEPLGYTEKMALAKVTATSGDHVLLEFANRGSLAHATQSMAELKQSIETLMDSMTEDMSQISSQAVADLSASVDAWDVVSFMADITHGLSEIPDGASQALTESMIKATFKKVTFDHVWPELAELSISETAQEILPDSQNGWRHWKPSDLKQFDLWQDVTGFLENQHQQFSDHAQDVTTEPTFDFGKAENMIGAQSLQLDRVALGQPAQFVVLPDDEPSSYMLGLPSSHVAWKANHVGISLTGGIKKVGITAKSAGVGLCATGIGAKVGAVLYAGGKITEEVSGKAQLALKAVGGVVYGINALAWAHDLAVLPSSYAATRVFLEQEATNPYYLSSSNHFDGSLSLDLDTIGGIQPMFFGRIALKDADVTVTNTSNLPCLYRIVPRGWWQYRLPGDWRFIGGLFGNVSEIKVPTTVSLPYEVYLEPGESTVVQIPYAGFYIDPVNMYSPYWLRLDLYAGPFLVDTCSKSYQVIKLLPPSDRCTAEAQFSASMQRDGETIPIAPDDYEEMAPEAVALCSDWITATDSSVEVPFTVGENVWEVRFKLIADPRAEIALQVYDEADLCVGYDIQRGGLLNEFVATYTGELSPEQDVIVPNCAGRTYRVRAVLQGGTDPGPFKVQLFAMETPLRPAVLGVLTDRIERRLPWNTVFDLDVTIGEGGQQQPLEDVQVGLSTLAGADPEDVLPLYTARTLAVGDIPAGSAESVTFELSVPWTTPVGDYLGEILVTSANAGSVTIPVMIQVDDERGDLNRDGLVNMHDFAILGDFWLATEGHVYPYAVDRGTQEESVDLDDLMALAEAWLWQASWVQE